jgi:hypothetical protein
LLDGKSPSTVSHSQNFASRSAQHLLLSRLTIADDSAACDDEAIKRAALRARLRKTVAGAPAST